MLSEKDMPGAKRKAQAQALKDAEPKCINCTKKATQDDFCFSCKQFVCNDCSTNVGLLMKHNVKDHWTYTAIMK